jgi:hypothetical protein
VKSNESGTTSNESSSDTNTTSSGDTLQQETNKQDSQMTYKELLIDSAEYIEQQRLYDVPDSEIFHDLIFDYQLDYDSAIYLLEQ